MGIDRIARLTDAQLEDVMNHPRDAEGKLIEPPALPRPVSLAEALMQAEAALVGFGASASQREEAFALVRAKYGEGR